MDSGIKVDYNANHVAFVAPSGKPHIVYSAPVVRLPSGKTTTVEIDWDVATSSIVIDLPDISAPVVVAFGLGISLPGKGGFGLSFPSFKFKGTGEISDSDSDNEKAASASASAKGGIKFPKVQILHFFLIIRAR